MSKEYIIWNIIVFAIYYTHPFISSCERNGIVLYRSFLDEVRLLRPARVCFLAFLFAVLLLLLRKGASQGLQGLEDLLELLVHHRCFLRAK